MTLGIDVGTTNIKVALLAWYDAGRGVDVDPLPSVGATTHATGGRVLAASAVPTPADVPALLGAVAAAVTECLTNRPGLVPDAVAVSSMAETGVPIDARGEALAPLVGWSDARARDLVAEIAADVDPEGLFRRTGVRWGPKPPLAKWCWFARREPGLWRRTAVWTGAADLVAHGLTGRYVTDHTLAGRSGAFPLDDGTGGGVPGFDPDLLALAGLTPERLPRVLAPGEPAGTTGAGALGAVLPTGIPVFVAGHDHAVGAHAVGVRAPGDVADSLGTSEAVYAVVDPVAPHERAAVAAHGMSVVRTVGGERHAVVAGSPAAGRLVAWWCRTLAAGRTPDDLFSGTDATADVDALVLPYPLGRQSPAPDPSARLEIRGIRDGDGPAVLAGALVRGLSLHARWMTEVACSGPPRSAVLLGGPTRNEGWVRGKAESSPWPVAVAADPDAVAVGAALVAAERVGLDPRPLATRPVPVRRGVETDRAVPTPDAQYAAFLAAVGVDLSRGAPRSRRRDAP